MLRIIHLMSARYFVGEAARVLDLAEQLIEIGHRSLVVVRRKQSAAMEANHRGIPYAAATFGSRFHPIADYCDVRLIRRLLDVHETDILHVHRGKDHWLGAWALAGCRRRIPLVRTRHVLTPIRDHLANRWLYGRATQGLISVSQAVRQAVDRDLPGFAGPQAVIPGGVLMRRLHEVPGAAAELRARLHIPPGSTVLTLLARIAPVKGQAYAIEALPAILAQHPQTVLILAHPRSGSYREEVENRIRSLRLFDRVRWVGKLDQLGPLLSLTDIGLVTSIGSEGWSRVAAEFQVKGVPVIATRVGSLPEIVRDQETGLLIPPADPAALAQAVAGLIADRDRRARMGSAALAESAHLTHARMTEDVLSFYERVLR